jgi:Xaa-Pro aminopeptidase
MAALAVVVNDVLTTALAQVESGTTEHELEGWLAEAIATHGARLPVVLVAADERITRYRHPIPTQTVIHGRVMAGVVAEKWGLHVAASQFREIEPRSPELESRAQAIADVCARMRAATHAGSTLGDVFEAARAAYAEHSMADEWTRHHQGGTIGYAARERIATPADPTPIKPGMAFAWNPSTAGYKMEETLYLDEAGVQHVLTAT